jgi:hypothetical protein
MPLLLADIDSLILRPRKGIAGGVEARHRDVHRAARSLRKGRRALGAFPRSRVAGWGRRQRSADLDEKGDHR